jgi:hypothetical protein
MSSTTAAPLHGTRTWATDLFADVRDAANLEWGRAAARFAVADTARSLASRKLLQRWLAFGNLQYPQFNVGRGGEATPPTLYTRAQTYGARRLTGCADPEKIAALVRDGATLTLSNPERWDEGLAGLCRSLRRETETDVQAFVYLTAPNCYGSRPHRDAAEVFVIQNEGTKRWYLYDIPAGDDWKMGHIGGEPQPSEILELGPGDGLYVPAGMGHCAQAGPNGSLHTTISLRTPRMSEVLTAWVTAVARALPRNERLPMEKGARFPVVRELLLKIAKEAQGAAAADIDGLLRSMTTEQHIPDISDGDLSLRPQEQPHV